MMNSKTLHNGFSFAEVMIALMMIGFLLTSLLGLQSVVFRRVVMNTFRIDRFYPLKNMALTMPMQSANKNSHVKAGASPTEPGQRREKTDEALGLKMVYETSKIKDNSVLHRFEGLFQKRSVGTWFEQDRERMQEVLSYGFAVPEKDVHAK